MMKRGLVVGLGLCLSAAFSASPVVAAETVKVGLIADFTGAFAAWGAQFQRSVEAYQAVYGKTIKGPKGEDIEVQVVYRDAASAGADKAKQLAEELVLRERVKILTGFDLSPHAMAVAEIATQVKMPVVLMNASTASITRGSPYFVRVSNTLPQWLSALGKWVAESGVKTAYTLVTDYAPGHDAETYFHKAFTAAGGKIVGSARTPQQETNFSVHMERVLQAKPDALYIFQPSGAPSIAAVKAFMERGLKQAGIKLFAAGEMDELYLPHFTDDVTGVVSVSHYVESNDSPENKTMRAQLAKMHGANSMVDLASVGAWDGMNVIYSALRETGAAVDGPKFVAAVAGKTFKSPRGEITIDPEERDVIQNVYIRRVEKKDGKLVNTQIGMVPMVKDPWKIDNPVKK